VLEEARKLDQRYNPKRLDIIDALVVAMAPQPAAPAQTPVDQGWRKPKTISP
jgi:hypothetical protein